MKSTSPNSGAGKNLTKPTCQFAFPTAFFSIWAALAMFNEAPARADFYLHHWEDRALEEKEAKMGLTGFFAYSSSNFSSAGTPSTSSGFQNYLKGVADLNTAVGLSSVVTLYGRLSWAYIRESTTSQNLNSFGFADQTLGMTFRLLHRKFEEPNSDHWLQSLELQFQGDFPAYSPASTTSNQPLGMGDGSIDFTAGLFAGFPIGEETGSNSVRVRIGAGFTYRTGGFSSSIPVSVSLQFNPNSSGIFLGLHSYGIISLRTDTSNIPTASSSDTFYIGAINPTLLQVTGQVGLRLQSLNEVSISATQNFWGQNSPAGFNFAANYTAHFGIDRPSKDTFHLSPRNYGKSNRGFVNYSLDTSVLKANDRLNLVKIDKGSQDGIKVGQAFDIFEKDTDGSPKEAVARGRVTHIREDEAVLEIIEYFEGIPIEAGFIAKRVIE